MGQTTPITLHGRHLSTVLRVTVGAAEATDVQVVSDSEVTATAPASTRSAVNIRALTATRRSNILALVNTPPPAPSITSVSPASVPLAGSEITITGDNLSSAFQVKFGSIYVTSLTVVDASTVTVTAPAVSTPGTIDIWVRTPGGHSPISAAARLTYGASRPAPWSQVQPGADAITKNKTHIPMSPDCPTRAVQANPIAGPLVESAVGVVATLITKLRVKDPEAAATEPPWLVEQIPDYLKQADPAGHLIVTNAGLVEILDDLALALGDLSGTSPLPQLEQQLTTAIFGLTRIPTDISDDTFVHWFQAPLTPTSPPWNVTCVTTTDSNGMRLYHYGEDSHGGWFIGWDNQFVKVNGVDLSQYKIYPVPGPKLGREAPMFYLTKNVDGPFANPLYVMTFDQDPLDNCKDDADDREMWANVGRQVAGQAVTIAGSILSVRYPLASFAQPLAEAAGGLTSCYSVSTHPQEVMDAYNHQVTVSTGGFATSADGRIIAVNQIRSTSGLPGSSQNITRYQMRNGVADAGVEINQGQYLAVQIGYDVSVPVIMSPDGRYVATCNTGHDPEVYYSGTDRITYPANVPYVDPRSCSLDSLSNKGLLVFGAINKQVVSRQAVRWTYQAPNA